MNQKQLLQVQSLRRSKVFLDDHPNVAGALNSTNAKRRLDASVARPGPTVVEPDTRLRETRGEGGRRKQLERELRVDHMSPIAEFARAQLRGSPHFAALTPAASRLVGERLVNSALSMADAAEPYTAQFTEAQFPADFLAQLRTAAKEVLHSIDTKAKKQGQRAGATKRIDSAIAEGRTAIQALKPVVKRALRNDDALLAEWRSAHRIVKKAVRPAVGAEAATPATNPSPEVKAA